MEEKLSRNYCCRYYNNSAPFSFHFSTLQHQLNDLRIFEPDAQFFLYSTLTTNHRLITALKQNPCMRRRDYPVLWSINRNSKALNGLTREYRATHFHIIAWPPLFSLHMLAIPKLPPLIKHRLNWRIMMIKIYKLCCWYHNRL